MDPLKLSVLMPVYNERYLVGSSLERVLEFQDPRVREIEVVIVDDASTDGSAEILEEFAGKDSRIRLFRQEKNQGKGAAIRRGIKEARGDLAVVQDADLEYNPSDWSRMLCPFFEAEADVVYGSRFLHGEYRRILYFRHTLGNRLLTLLSNLATDLNLSDMETCYKMVRTEMLRSIPIRSNDFSFEPEITAKLAKRKARIFEVPIQYTGRTYEEGKKIRFRHALTAFYAIVKWWLLDDLYSKDRFGAEILSSLAGAPRFNQWMADTIRGELGDRVLEIGAGIGNITTLVIPRSRYLATEINPNYLQFLRKRAYAKPYLEVSALDISDSAKFQAIEASFDSVICLNVLEHVSEEEQALQNIKKALEPGGRAIILVPQGRWLFSSLDRALGHVKRYTRRDLREALENAGFQVLSIRSFNRCGLPGWLLNGKIFRRRTLSRYQLELLNLLYPVLRRIDWIWPWHGLSLIAVAQKN